MNWLFRSKTFVVRSLKNLNHQTKINTFMLLRSQNHSISVFRRNPPRSPQWGRRIASHAGGISLWWDPPWRFGWEGHCSFGPPSAQGHPILWKSFDRTFPKRWNQSRSYWNAGGQCSTWRVSRRWRGLVPYDPIWIVSWRPTWRTHGNNSCSHRCRPHPPVYMVGVYLFDSETLFRASLIFTD